MDDYNKLDFTDKREKGFVLPVNWKLRIIINFEEENSKYPILKSFPSFKMTEPLDQNRLKILSYLHFPVVEMLFLFFSQPFFDNCWKLRDFLFCFVFLDILPLFSSHPADRSYRNGLMKLYTALVTNVEMTLEKPRVFEKKKRQQNFICNKSKER